MSQTKNTVDFGNSLAMGSVMAEEEEEEEEARSSFRHRGRTIGPDHVRHLPDKEAAGRAR